MKKKKENQRSVLVLKDQNNLLKRNIQHIQFISKGEKKFF